MMKISYSLRVVSEGFYSDCPPLDCIVNLILIKNKVLPIIEHLFKIYRVTLGGGVSYRVIVRT